MDSGAVVKVKITIDEATRCEYASPDPLLTPLDPLSTPSRRAHSNASPERESASPERPLFSSCRGRSSS
eukprot:1183542-Prorocentrum_minimum.AAC.1